MRVLIVEETAGSEVLAGLLTERGHRSTRVRLDASAPSVPGDVDVVVFDLGIPNKGVLTMLRGLRSVSQVPVLVVAARREEYPNARWVNAGADGYLRRPADPGELVTRIESLGRRPWLPEQAERRAVSR